MAWRSYVDPSDSQVWWTDDAGNFIPGSQFQPPPGGGSSGGKSAGGVGGSGGGQQYAGGGYGLSDAAAAQQLALLVRRLEEVEIPGLNIQQKQMLINALSQMQQSSGYINPGLWQQILGATGGGGTGGGAGLTSEAALDWIAERRPDVLDYHKQNGWDVSTPAAKRAAVQNWIGQVDPQWSGKTPQAVAAELGYQGTTGGGAGAGTAGTGVYQQMIDWYKSRTDAGQTPTQDQWVQRLVQLTGITPEQANLMYQRGRDYQAVTGQGRPSEAEWSGWLTQIAPQKTLARDIADEQKRQFDLEQKQQGQQFWGNLLASKSGPRDYWTANMLQASMPENVKWGDMQSLVRNTPSFGAMTPSDSWESTFKNWVEQQKGGGAETRPTPGQPRFDGGPVREERIPPQPQAPLPPGLGLASQAAIRNQQGQPGQGGFQGGPTTEPVDWRGKFQQPNQLTPRDWNAMRGSLQESQRGSWSAYGLPDAEEVMKRSWNTGGGGISGRKSWR